MLMNVTRLLANMVVGVWTESMATVVIVLLLDILVHTAKLVSIEICILKSKLNSVLHLFMLMPKT